MVLVVSLPKVAVSHDTISYWYMLCVNLKNFLFLFFVSVAGFWISKQVNAHSEWNYCNGTLKQKKEVMVDDFFFATEDNLTTWFFKWLEIKLERKFFLYFFAAAISQSRIKDCNVNQYVVLLFRTVILEY